MSIPVTDRVQTLVSSTNNESNPVGVTAKGTYWVIYSSYGNLSIKEYLGVRFQRIGIAVPYFYVTPALDMMGALNTNRFWLWFLTRTYALQLLELEPHFDKAPTVHNTVQLATNVLNVKAQVEPTKDVNVYCLFNTLPNTLKLFIYDDVLTGVPLKTVDLYWALGRNTELSQATAANRLSFSMGYGE